MSVEALLMADVGHVCRNTPIKFIFKLAFARLSALCHLGISLETTVEMLLQML